MILFKKHRFGVKAMIRTAALTLISAAAVLLTGCSDGKKLSDKELTNVLSEILGNTVEIIRGPEENTENTEYGMKCADGTEFTVTRVHLDYDYFGANRYYQYECDYLLKWVSNHPELNALFDERGISYENYSGGTRAVARSFDEIHTVVETACAVVESGSYRIPAAPDYDGKEYKVVFARPDIMIDCLNGKDEKTEWLWEKFEYQDGTDPVDHDEELQVFLAEREYVDNMRHGDIKDDTHVYLLEKYGPSQMKAKLKNSEYSMPRADNKRKDFPVGKTETVYYVSDGFKNKNAEKLDFPYIAEFAEFTGFEPYSADRDSYTLARGEEKVVFRFSESGSYAERSGVRTELRGKVNMSNSSCYVDLTTDDLTKLFDTEFKFDYVNGTAEITNMKV